MNEAVFISEWQSPTCDLAMGRLGVLLTDEAPYEHKGGETTRERQRERD